LPSAKAFSAITLTTSLRVKIVFCYQNCFDLL
jgi:hypothetical protein